MNNIIIQIIGIIAWILLFISYKTKNTKMLISIQVCSSALYVLHYYLLGAYTGIFVCSLSFIYGLLLSFVKQKKIIYLMLIPILTSGLYFFYTENIFSIVPIFASFIDNYALTRSKRFILQMSIISYTLWVIYDIFVKSYSCMITDSLLLISNLSLLIFNINLLKQDTKHIMKTREELFK